jgi:putative ABC transport system permease protein
VITSGGDPTGGMLPRFFFPIKDLALGIGLSLLLGVVTGIMPAMAAMRLKVADALRRM